jgi:hypothetical protein
MAQFVVTGITLAGRRSIQLHVQCFQLWDAERLRAIASPPDSAFAADIAGSADGRRAQRVLGPDDHLFASESNGDQRPLSRYVSMRA